VKQERQKLGIAQMLPGGIVGRQPRNFVLSEMAADMEKRQKNKAIYSRVVKNFRILFEATREARHLADALRWCKEADLAVPHWLRDALSDLLASGNVDQVLRRDTPKRRNTESRRTIIWCFMQDLRRWRGCSTQGESDIHALAERAAELWNKEFAQALGGRITGETARKDYYAELRYHKLVVECQK
jgi:hypothetical protein